jgi:hypothetical protein
MSIEMNVEIKKGMFLRTLRPEDRAALAVYFEALGVETRRRFQPHPLTREAAAALCDEAEPSAIRLVIERRGGLIGYFILERGLPVYETPRYREFGVDLAAGSDLLFAPSVADAWQNRGIASDGRHPSHQPPRHRILREVWLQALWRLSNRCLQPRHAPVAGSVSACLLDAAVCPAWYTNI